jgi:hypothetical protein
MVKEGQLLWEPPEKWLAEANVTVFREWLERTRNLRCENHQELHRWSVNHRETGACPGRSGFQERA